MNSEKITVMGAGLMGYQIALQTAQHGYKVACYDVSKEMLRKAEADADKWLKSRVEKGKMTQEQMETTKKALLFTDDVKAAADGAGLVVEAVPDILDVKLKALAEIDKYTPQDCVYASNSSYIVSSRFCNAVAKPENVLNVHFFNPALVMKIVEIVKGPHVSAQTFQRAWDFVVSIDKTPICVEKEIYGFVVNRIFSALTREACYLVDMGVASPEDIDKAVKGALGHSMGPLETLDMTGIDLEYNVYMEKFRASGKKEDLPAACLSLHYSKGEYGRKTKKGFYDYSD